ncbi:MAG: topology modulation protein [Oscillospiraceae bacterium]|nr:topology modulation protein [Oscillospiraceae bacterium]
MIYSGKEYKRIIVIGCSGSGKSTFSRKLAEITDLPLIHLDAAFWQENWTHLSREEFDIWLESEVQKDRWIIDGNYNRTLEMRLKHADTVIDFRIPRYQCLSGVIKRYFKYRNTSRLDMAKGCNEKIDFDFLKFIWNFNKKDIPQNDEKIRKYPNADHIIFTSRKQSEEFLKLIQSAVY